MSRWIMVADASRARFFSAGAGKGGLIEREDRIHAKSRFHGRDLETDAPARTFDSAGPGRHAVEPSTDVHEQEVETFAHELAVYLGNAYEAGRFQQLYIVAPPHFLGLLRKQLDKNVSAAIVLELDKDLTKHSVEDIRNHLPEFL
ncbi:MAG: host attachment protein [Gammaproteobacteria bacterium]|nr:host attachment protein [Gammaproteobacteria bacterium]MBU1724682.1 host attachment protein [Gammaproteobacteria bacterium]MBU2005858.1 host attachment protein [Gammaproteobacteria bacterium]